ncbi:MAG TPA: hypothetical protein VFW98_00150, partial [Gemmatimonadaceae bacterium]|nr:hypothetical protein [Gemmatimonadaceae bacterium]
PMYWVRPPRNLSAQPGMHRFVWNLYYTPATDRQGGYPISAIVHDTPREPQGLLAEPARYTVRLTVNGHSYTQPLTIKQDPRVKTPAAGLAREYALAGRIYTAMRRDYQALNGVKHLRTQLAALHGRATDSTLARAIDALDGKAAALTGGRRRSGPRGGAATGGDSASSPTLSQLNSQLGSLLQLVQNADATPTTQAVAAADSTIRSLAEPLARWKALMAQDVPALNDRLRRTGLPEIVAGKR